MQQKKRNNFKENWLTQLLQSPHIGILVVDENRNNLYANPRLCEMFGYSAEELLQKNTQIFHVSQKHYEEFGKKAFSFVLSGKPIELDYQFKRKDGSIFWGHIAGDLISNKEEVLWTVIDITERKNLEKEWYKQSQFLKQMIDGFLVTDLNNTITYWNDGAERITGYKKEEVLHKNTIMFYQHNDLATRNKILNILKEDGVFRGELTIVTKSGALKEIELNASTFKDIDGNVVGLVGYFKDIHEQKAIQRELEYQAHHDTLTGLANRVLFFDRMSQAIKKAKRDHTIVALLYIDLDHFKEINDSLGHEIGDKVLIETTKRLQSVIREGDSFARLGGDEFTIIVEDLHNAQDVSLFAQKLLDALKEPLVIDHHKFYISSSIGISLYPQDGDTAKDLLKFADAAMYKAKEEGRNNYQFYSSDMTELAFERIVLEAQLRDAIKNKEFEVYYQPQVDILNNTLTGFEALVRWKHPQLGIVSPARFVSLAEKTGLITEIDYFVMEEAMKQFKQWYDDGFNPGVLALNLSTIHLNNELFLSRFEEILNNSLCNCAHIELELTESQIMKDPEKSISTLNILRDMQISIAVDDFGTGYSSLAYLKRLPLTKLKIDQSFIRELPHDEEDAAIVTAIIALAQSLKLNIIAEGVETPEQLNFLKEHQCSMIQGYYFSKPLTTQETQELLQDAQRLFNNS